MRKGLGRHNYRSAGGLIPSLVLDFAGTGTLDPRVTFTRSTTATYTNSSEALTTAAINAARFDYNPSTLAALGLLLEEQRTNVLLNSLLDGTNLTTQTVITGAVPYTLSFYGTGTIVLAGTNISTQVGTGAYPSRKTFTFTPTAGNLTLTVTGTVQYAQLEAGSFASSFIPTAGAQVTRAADSAVMTGTNFSSWFNASQGTLYTETNFTSTVFITRGIFIAPTSYSDNTIVTANWYQNTGQPANFKNDPFGTSAVSSPTISGIGNLKSAIAYQSANSAGAINGTIRYTDSSAGSGGVTFTQLNFNEGGVHLNGYIKKIAYYPIRVTNAQLQALTGS